VGRTPFPDSITLSRHEALNVLAALLQGVLALEMEDELAVAFELLDQALLIEAKLVEGGSFPDA
jgi:hypothetical protein